MVHSEYFEQISSYSAESFLYWEIKWDQKLLVLLTASKDYKKFSWSIKFEVKSWDII